MPIFAPFPLVNTPGELPDAVDTYAAFNETRGFAFRSIDGARTLEFTGREFIARWGIQGLDVPKRTLVEEDIPTQDGTDLTDIKIGSRSWAMPIFIGSDTSHLDFLDKRSQMRAFFNHRGIDFRSNAGTFDLVAVSALGERTLRSAYVDGMDGSTWDQDTSGSFWETFGLQAVAVNPYWHGGTWSTEIIRPPQQSVTFFGRFPPSLAARNVTNSAASIFVDGDVASWPQVYAYGPCSALSVVGEELLLDVPNGLDDGETLFIDTDPRNKRVEFSDVSDWSRLSPLSVQAPLNVGDQTLTLTLEDPGANSSIQVSGTSWFETPW